MHSRWIQLLHGNVQIPKANAQLDIVQSDLTWCLIFRASTRLCTYDLPRLCTCDSPRLCTYDFVVDAIRMQASCAMGHSNVLVLDMHVLFGTKMFALLLGSMVFCIVNAKHVELLRQDGFDLRVEKSCLSSLTGILLCCMCNLSCEFFTQKFCQRHLNLVVEMLVITTLIGVMPVSYLVFNFSAENTNS